MSEWNQIACPVGSLDMTNTDIVHTFTRYIVGAFPNGTFDRGAVFVDTKNLLTDSKRKSTGIKDPDKLRKPYLEVTTEGLSDILDKDNNGPDVIQYSMLPGTTTDRRLENNHRLPMLRDDYAGIVVDTIEFRRKIELEFKFTLDSKADVLTMKSYIYNFISMHKNNILEGVMTNILLPNILINDISKLAFPTDKFDHTSDISMDALVEYLNLTGTVPFERRIEKYGNDDENWFLMNRLFSLNYRAGELSKEEAKKQNKIYEEFEFGIIFTLDYKLPNSYILNYKVFNGINKAIIEPQYFNSVKNDKDCNIHHKHSPTVFVEDRETILPVSYTHQLVIREEFFMETPDDFISVADFISKETPYREIFSRLTISERSDIFEVHVYENGVPIGLDEMEGEMYTNDLVYLLSECDTNVSFCLYIHLNMDYFYKMLPVITHRIENHEYAYLDENGNPLQIGSYPESGDFPSNSIIDYSKFGTIDPITGMYIRKSTISDKARSIGGTHSKGGPMNSTNIGGRSGSYIKNFKSLIIAKRGL